MLKMKYFNKLKFNIKKIIMLGVQYYNTLDIISYFKK